MELREQIIGKLSSNKELLKLRYPLKSIAIFGSVARGEATPTSDVDILVEFASPIGMEIVDLVTELEELLNRKVDLVSAKAVKDRMRPFIEKDIIYV